MTDYQPLNSAEEMVERAGEILFKDWRRDDREPGGPYEYWRGCIRQVLALPAAQDGDYPANIREAMDALDWWARHYVMADDYDPKADVRTLTGYMRLQQLSTPNAIRGDKGAEAVDALPIRDVKEIVSKYVGRTSRIYLYIANDLSQLHREQLAAAPTQAAAKEGSDAH